MTRKFISGLTAVNYSLPAKIQSLEELVQAGTVSSSPDFLRDLGFSSCHTHTHGEPFENTIITCGENLLVTTDVNRESIGWVFKYSGMQNTYCRSENVLESFKYPATEAHYRYQLPSATSIAISQQGCSGLLSMVKMADAMLQTTDSSAILCIAGDALNDGSNREILYNIMSDAACAVLVEKNPARNRIVGYQQSSHPHYWNTPECTNEVLAAYFPLAARTIERTLDEASWTIDDIDWIIPHNVSQRSWEILTQLVGTDMEKVWSKNISRIGHTVSCDHVINLSDMQEQGVLKAGDKMLMFTFGLGATWTCMLLEH